MDPATDPHREGVRQLQDQIRNDINRAIQESRLSVCEILGVLNLVRVECEQSIIRKQVKP